MAQFDIGMPEFEAAVMLGLDPVELSFPTPQPAPQPAPQPEPQPGVPYKASAEMPPPSAAQQADTAGMGADEPMRGSGLPSLSEIMGSQVDVTPRAPASRPAANEVPMNVPGPNITPGLAGPEGIMPMPGAEDDAALAMLEDGGFAGSGYSDEPAAPAVGGNWGQALAEIPDYNAQSAQERAAILARRQALLGAKIPSLGDIFLRAEYG